METPPKPLKRTKASHNFLASPSVTTPPPPLPSYFTLKVICHSPCRLKIEQTLHLLQLFIECFQIPPLNFGSPFARTPLKWKSRVRILSSALTQFHLHRCCLLTGSPVRWSKFTLLRAACPAQGSAHLSRRHPKPRTRHAILPTPARTNQRIDKSGRGLDSGPCALPQRHHGGNGESSREVQGKGSRASSGDSADDNDGTDAGEWWSRLGLSTSCRTAQDVPARGGNTDRAALS